MPSLWFIMPAHGRENIASVCMRQLSRTIDELCDNGIEGKPLAGRA